jgi:hypothetical protein
MGAATCDSCVPSAFSYSKFKCYSSLAQGLVIGGYVVSLFSILFSAYKLRISVRERLQKLKDAFIKPSIMRLVFLERALAEHSKRMLISPTELASTTELESVSSSTITKSNPTRDEEVLQMVRDFQSQVQKLQQQQQQQHQQLHLQFQQQQQQLLQEISRLQQEMQQLTQQFDKFQDRQP